MNDLCPVRPALHSSYPFLVSAENESKNTSMKLTVEMTDTSLEIRDLWDSLVMPLPGK